VSTSLDGRTFKMISSTASVVDPESPSVFEYRERDGIVWGDYTGDTVTFGRFVGTREGDRLRISFVHRLVVDGTVVAGTGESDVRVRDGRLALVEEFEIDGAAHESVCIEA